MGQARERDTARLENIYEGRLSALSRMPKSVCPEHLESDALTCLLPPRYFHHYGSRDDHHTLRHHRTGQMKSPTHLKYGRCRRSSRRPLRVPITGYCTVCVLHLRDGQPYPHHLDYDEPPPRALPLYPPLSFRCLASIICLDSSMAARETIPSFAGELR